LFFHRILKPIKGAATSTKKTIVATIELKLSPGLSYYMYLNCWQQQIARIMKVSLMNSIGKFHIMSVSSRFLNAVIL